MHVPRPAGRRMRASLGARLAGDPERAHAQMHRARALLPARAAAVLRAAPDLAAPAVEAFHYRDADDMRAAARMARFPPEVGGLLRLLSGELQECGRARLIAQQGSVQGCFRLRLHRLTPRLSAWSGARAAPRFI